MNYIEQNLVVYENRKLYSLQEVADFLHCSVVTAQKFKNEGRFPYWQVGRKCIFDTEKILKAMEKTTKKAGNGK